MPCPPAPSLQGEGCVGCRMHGLGPLACVRMCPVPGQCRWDTPEDEKKRPSLRGELGSSKQSSQLRSSGSLPSFNKVSPNNLDGFIATRKALRDLAMTSFPLRPIIARRTGFVEAIQSIKIILLLALLK